MRVIYRFTFVLALYLSVAPLQAQSVNPRDLQGIWTNATITPFERAAELVDRQFLTEKEARELVTRAAETRVDRPPPPGEVGNYNQFWSDSGTQVVKTRRTSLVVEPKNGRVPVRPEAKSK